MSRSDLLVGIGAPVVGLIAIVVGLTSGDTTTAIFGAVALLTGLMFAVPLLRSRRDGSRHDPPQDR